jgi:hypothetical protein
MRGSLFSSIIALHRQTVSSRVHPRHFSASARTATGPRHDHFPADFKGLHSGASKMHRQRSGYTGRNLQKLRKHVMRRISRSMLLAVAAATASRAQPYAIQSLPPAPHGIFTMMQDGHSALWMGTTSTMFLASTAITSAPSGRMDFPGRRQTASPRTAMAQSGSPRKAPMPTTAQGAATLYCHRAGHVEKIHDGDGLTVVAFAPGIVIVWAGTEINDKHSYGDLILFRKSQDRGLAAREARRSPHP